MSAGREYYHRTASEAEYLFASASIHETPPDSESHYFVEREGILALVQEIPGGEVDIINPSLGNMLPILQSYRNGAPFPLYDPEDGSLGVVHLDLHSAAEVSSDVLLCHIVTY